MSTLVLELRPGDMMIVNGAPIRFRNRTRIELTARARFLFGKQLMTPDMADTPARRIYFALQTAYIGDHEERQAGLEQAKGLIGEFKEATTSALAREYLDRALTLAVNINVIVITDENASTVRIEKQVSKGNILIAEPFEMELVKAIR